jgi:hypothetical protein
MGDKLEVGFGEIENEVVVAHHGSEESEEIGEGLIMDAICDLMEEVWEANCFAEGDAYAAAKGDRGF